MTRVLVAARGRGAAPRGRRRRVAGGGAAGGRGARVGRGAAGGGAGARAGGGRRRARARAAGGGGRRGGSAGRRVIRACGLSPMTRPSATLRSCFWRRNSICR